MKFSRVNKDVGHPQVAGDETSFTLGCYFRNNEFVEFIPGDYKLIKTGVSLIVPVGYVLQTHPLENAFEEAGLQHMDKHTYAPGDTGEIAVRLINGSDNAVILRQGDVFVRFFLVRVRSRIVLEEVSNE